ncbi:isoleucyl-tRNA synthetase [Whalleya microplaca]|nr:isoleucyl-tRNA synthetase [Whalleya microplaca]
MWKPAKYWTGTLKLPNSTFPPRPHPSKVNQYIKQCADNLYEWQKQNRPSDDTFVLHDGPPYANGNLHVGHALNKILKDMILRVKVQQGRQVEYVPGWDCHGLPIELKALGIHDSKQLTPFEIRKAARNLASNNVLRQMNSFRSYGVMGDWDEWWTTMDSAFELRQLRLFQQMAKQGLIYRKFKPVYWSPSSRTALAEAELEYRDDHISNAAWVRFPITDEGRNLPQFESLQDKVQGKLYAVIWTTTPWTLPANRAIAIHDDLEYCVIRYGANSLVIAKSRLETFVVKTGAEAGWGPIEAWNKIEILGILEGRQLKGLKYTNHLLGKAGRPQPLIHADFVSADSGSGLVHLAPGHGFDDYEVCRSLGIPISAPIDDYGKFTKDAFPDAPELLLSAPSVNEGGGESVLDLLRPLGDVLLVEKYEHKYPYDWRTKQPVIIRATEQWFADVESIKQETLKALDDVRFIPESGRKRLESFVRGRSEWCISRQRAWGVPIPALYDKSGKAVINDDVVDHIISVIDERGSHAWWSDDPDDPAWIPSSLKGEYRRGTDTMDVWFDSGSSWTMMKRRADLYLEGSDQHRGWFQSSMLTRIAAGATAGADFEKGAPFKTLITHGFTLDQDGRKMSKSLGNVIEPQQVIDGALLPPVKRNGKLCSPVHNKLGADELRLWAASSDYTRDVVIGLPTLQAVHAAHLKYRTTAKMLLGSLQNRRIARWAPLGAVDQIAILQMQDAMEEVGRAFASYEFHRAYSALNRWLVNDLSAFYIEARKDRLYCGDGGGAIEPLLMGFLRMLAPMAPLLVEEAWDHRPEWMQKDDSLIHPHQHLYNAPLIDPSRLPYDSSTLRSHIPVLMSAHAAIKAALERARAAKVVGSSLQSTVVLVIPDAATRAVYETYASELEVMFVVSSVSILADRATREALATADMNTYKKHKGVWEYEGTWAYVQDLSIDGVKKGEVVVMPPDRHKCPRCWRHVAPVEDALCGRCEDAMARRGRQIENERARKKKLDAMALREKEIEKERARKEKLAGK